MNKKIPVRSCIVCRIKKAQNELLRIGIDQEENKSYLGKGNGRGVYLCFSNNCLEQAKKRKNISRALKCDEKIINFDEISGKIEDKS